MTIYIAFLLIYGFHMHWIFYVLTVAIWLVQRRVWAGSFSSMLDRLFPDSP